ncbi:helix-turn-helix transcriptional regulator [Phytohabitans maris]|uniref:helix-turn-helix transcriptional regulator n=1 Tax=Phytohabitans maris TaxID=3071409 RepID=UPI003D164BA3
MADLASRGTTPTVPRVVADALHERTVLRIEYADRHGTATTRCVEPLGYIADHDHWYLVAWCRLRDGVRAFRTDRIESLTATGEPAPPPPQAPHHHKCAAPMLSNTPAPPPPPAPPPRAGPPPPPPPPRRCRSDRRRPLAGTG